MLLTFFICGWHGGWTYSSGIGPSSTVSNERLLPLLSEFPRSSGSVLGNCQKWNTINLHSPHIIWLPCAVLSTWQICTTNQYQVLLYYTNVLSARLLLPALTCNFNDNCLWQKVSTESVLLTFFICGWHGGWTYSSGIGPSSTVSNERLLPLLSEFPCSSGSVLGNCQ